MKQKQDLVTLRPVIPGDVLVFFQQQKDPEATRMAAFAPRHRTDRDAFVDRWVQLLADESVTKKSIIFHSRLAGHLVSFEEAGRREVGFWIGRGFWGRGIATAALRLFVAQEPARPLFARAGADNAASIRVLEKCGFAVVDADGSSASAHPGGAETADVILRLG